MPHAPHDWLDVDYVSSTYARPANARECILGNETRSGEAAGKAKFLRTMMPLERMNAAASVHDMVQ
jgi:hypothetical protein